MKGILMTSISELSDEPKFKIKKVSEQTGIRTVTLRAWERRYGILAPQRAENRYRLYSERDIGILFWIKSRLDKGLSISVAAVELEKMRESGQWAEVITVQFSHRRGGNTKSIQTYADQLYHALMHHDELRANEVFQAAGNVLGLKTLLLSIVTPCLVEIGEAWYRGDISITTEHFASTFLRAKLLVMLLAVVPNRRMPKLLVGGAPSEQHEIGPLMMSVLLRNQGYPVEFLGPDLPLEDLTEYARLEKPAMVILSATTEPAALELRPMQAMLNRVRPMPIFAYGGRAFNLKPDLQRQVMGVFLGETMDEALENIAALVK
jgi:DNA-binding transcriptional MerR regulator